MANPFGAFNTEKKEEIKTIKTPEVKQEVKPAPRHDDTPRVILSHEDAYVHDRMQAQPSSLDEIDLKVEQKEFSVGQSRLSTPEPLKKYESKYTFRWILKNKRAIDWACNVKGWYLVNQTYFPDIPNVLFTVNGSVEEGDNVLAFMPKKKAEYLRSLPGKQSQELVNSRIDAHKDNPNYYVPKDEETKEVVGL